MTRAAALAWARRFALGALGTALALYATAPRGPSLSPDSAIYLSVADRLIEGGEFTQFDDQPMTRWAPLYPALVAGVAKATGATDAAQAARAVDALALGAALLLLVLWLDRHVRSRALRWIATLTLLVAPMLLQCAAFVWSETTYLLLVLLALRFAEAHLSGQRRAVLWLGLATGLAVVTRYAGIALVPVAVLALWLPRDGTPKSRRVVQSLVVLALALLPLAFWVSRNLALTGHPFGESWPAHASFSRNSAIFLHIVSLWWFAPSVALPVRLAFVAILLSAVAIAFSRLIRLGVLGETRERAAVLPHVLFVGASAAVLLIWASISGIETISDRYAAPLFPSVVLLGTWAIDRLRAARIAHVLTLALSIAAVLLLWHSTERTMRLVQLYRGPGEWGYRTRNWEQSPTVAAAARLVPEGALVYSNAPDALYARNRQRSRLLPVMSGPVSEARGKRELAHAVRAVEQAGGAWIVEFESVQRSMLAPAASVAGSCPIDTVTRTDDGVILQIACP